MSYKIGFCPQCNEKLLIEDSNGQLNGFSPLWRQADLVFEDQTKVRTLICANCIKNPNFENLLESILHDDSEACTKTVKDKIRAKGAVIGILACEGVTKWQQSL